MNSPGFKKVEDKIWRDPKFRSLSCNDARQLFLYLLTNPHRHSSGIYSILLDYIATDTQMSIDMVKPLLTELIETGLVKHDYDAGILFIPKWLKYDSIKNEKHAKGIVKYLSSLPCSPLIAEWCRAALIYPAGKGVLAYLRNALIPFDPHRKDTPIDTPIDTRIAKARISKRSI